MKAYIYSIINTINNKRYVGQTLNIDERLYDHFYMLLKNEHHSHKLQNAYNLYGKDAFKVEYRMISCKDENELDKLEIKEIDLFDSYENGYNQTRGGDGNKRKFNFHDSVLFYQILQHYDGIMRYLGRVYKCDACVFASIKNNHKIFQDESYSKEEYDLLVTTLQLKEENKIENYIPHNAPKLDRQSCFEILSIITSTTGYDKSLCQIFNINSKLTYRLRNKLIYKNYIEGFESLPQSEKDKIKDCTFKKYNLESVKAIRARKGTKNPLTQEQVNYILDNSKLKTKTQIAKELNISIDRVSGIVNKKYYLDLINNYYSSQS